MLTSRRRPTALAVGLAALVLAPAAAQAASRGEPVSSGPVNGQPIPGEVLVGFKAGADGSDRAAARRGADVTVKRALSVPRVQLVATPRGESTAAAVARLERDPNVRYAEPNRWRTTSATTPDDPLFGQLWGLDNTGQSVNSVFGTADKDVDAPEAWDVFTGGDTLVAVVDEGVAYDHPDLAPNIWTNPGEVAGNGLDDDGNGFADDIHGVDFADGDSDPRDFGGHGTHVAGTIAAAGDNGIGLAGVSWSARLMAVRALGPDGGSDADIAAAFHYAADNGARVVNASLGGPGFSQTLQDSVSQHPNTLFVVAAGNDGVNTDVIAGGEYPCNFPDANLICVAATTQNDGLAGFSNRGPVSVDLGAPGTNILSTAPDRDDVRLSDGFEADDFATRWDPHVDVGSTPLWGRTSSSAASGSFSIADSPAGSYAISSKSYADLRSPISLSSRHGCVLSFRARIALAAGGANPVDAFTIDRTLDNGGSWPRLATFTSADNTGGVYRSFTIDLDADDRPSVRIGFGIETNSSGVADGVNVDDVAVRCIRPEAGTDAAYQFLNGTSMATPHVTGAAALLLGRKPSLTIAQLRSVLLTTGDHVAALDGNTVTGRRLNVDNAMLSPGALAPPPAPTAATQAASAIGQAGATLNGALNARGSATSWQFEYGATAAYGSTTPLTSEGAASRDTPVSASIGGLAPATTYHYRLVAVRGSDRFPGADVTFTTAAAPAAPSGGSLTPPAIVDPVVSLAQRVKGARVACSRKRGKYRCRVSLTRASGMKVRLVLRRGKKVVGRADGRVGKRVTLKGRRAKPGRYKVKLTFAKGTEQASITRRLRVR